MTNNIRKVFISGVAGMIGSNAARKLLNSGYQVVGVDNLWRGKIKNIEDLLSNPKFSFRHADVSSDRDWYKDLNDTDALIHIADIVAGIGYVFSNEWEVFQRNILINTQIARVINKVQPSKFIYLGTACSYPQTLQKSVNDSVLTEKDKLPADPESGYGWSKLIGEIEFRLALKDTKTKFNVLDLHNVYGWPCVYNDRTAQVIPSLIYKAITTTDESISVWGNGDQGRAFVHVNDVAQAIESTLRYDGIVSTMMIGPSYCTSIREVAELIQKHPRIKVSKINYDLSKPTGDIGRYADHSLATVELGWRPEVEFKVGLYELIDRIIDDNN